MSDHTDHNLKSPVTPAAATDGRLGGSALSERVRSLRLTEQSTSARPRGTWLPWSLCVLLGLTCGGLAYMAFGHSQELNELAAAQGGASNATGVLASSKSNDAVASSGAVVLERKGYVIPAHTILISPKVSGMIEKYFIIEGKHVRKGDILAQLETIDYQADYDRARATANSAWQRFLELYTGNRPEEIRQAKAELEENDAQRKQLYLDWKRNNRLSGSRALADRDYEQAESAYRSMERRVERMKQTYQLMLEGARMERIEGAWSDVEQAEADLVKAKWRLDNCTIRAPISGTILTKKAEEGNLVNPISFNGSFSVCEMADLSDMEVEMKIEEREVSKVFQGQRCRVRPEAYPDKVYEGEVSRLMPTADRANSAIPVRVKLTVPREEEGVYLKPDMGALVSFLKKAEKK